MKIIIFSEFSKKIGGGHYERSKRLKNKLKKKFSTFSYINFKKEKIKRIVDKIKEPCIVIYDFKDHSKSITNSNPKIKFILLESSGQSKKNIFHIDPLNLKRGPYNGPKWSCYPDDFFKKKRVKKLEKKKLLIWQGMTDAHNNINKIVNVIEPFSKIYNFKILIKKTSKFVRLSNKFTTNKNIQIIGRVQNISKLLSKIQFAITSCGNFCHEINFFGIKTLFVTSELREIKRAKIMEKLKFGKYVNINEKNLFKNQFKKFINVKKFNQRDTKKIRFFKKNGMLNLINLIIKLQKHVQK